jgi:hypothetical protein
MEGVSLENLTLSSTKEKAQISLLGPLSYGKRDRRMKILTGVYDLCSILDVS